jgi:hypothetical protein
MGQCYQKNKVHIYKWMANNKERKNEISKLSMAKAYLFKKEVMRLMKISI